MNGTIWMKRTISPTKGTGIGRRRKTSIQVQPAWFTNQRTNPVVISAQKARVCPWVDEAFANIMLAPNPSSSSAVTSPTAVRTKPGRSIIESAASTRRRLALQPTQQARQREIVPDIICLRQILVVLRGLLKVKRDKGYYLGTLSAGYCAAIVASYPWQKCLSRRRDDPIAWCPCLLKSAHGVPTDPPPPTSPYGAVAVAGA